MKKTLRIFLLAACALVATGVQAQDGLVKLTSPHDVATTMDKLEAVLKSKGMTVFARINHRQGAEAAGLQLRPTQVLIFGNPKIGTPLMTCSQSIAIDLPQKMLSWQAEDGTVYLAYNDPDYLKQRHSTGGCDPVFEKVAGALGKFAKAATSQ